MFSTETLKNLYKNELNVFIKKFGYKNIPKKLRGINAADYTPYVRFFESETKDQTTDLTKENVSDLLSERISFEKANEHILVELFSFNLTDLKSAELHKKVDELVNSEKYNDRFSRKFNSFDIVEVKSNYKHINGEKILHSLELIMFLENVNLLRGSTSFFCCIDINFSNKFVCLKFNKKLLESSQYFSPIINILSALKQNRDLSFLKINTRSFNQTTVQQTVQKLFIEMSQQAENILKENTNEKTEEQVQQFLNIIKVPNNEDYVNQIISVAYQHVSKTLSKELFVDGWAFRFVFREGSNTRASSTNTDLGPVYSKAVYWNLKELMFKQKTTEFIEAGFMWYTNEEKTSPVFIKLEQYNDYFRIYFYDKTANKINRREKENYVLSKIRRNLTK